MEAQKKGPRQPTTADLMNMMVLRQYALGIEKRAIELYWTDPRIFKKLTGPLKAVLEAYKEVAEPYKQDPPDSCDPFVLCPDGSCRAEGDCPS